MWKWFFLDESEREKFGLKYGMVSMCLMCYVVFMDKFCKVVSLLLIVIIVKCSFFICLKLVKL